MAHAAPGQINHLQRWVPQSSGHDLNANGEKENPTIEQNTYPVIRSDVLLGYPEEVLQWSLSTCSETRSEEVAAISLS